MTLPQVRALLRYWDDSPPVHVLLKGFVGYKPYPKIPLDDNAALLETEQYINRLAAEEFDALLKVHGVCNDRSEQD